MLDLDKFFDKIVPGLGKTNIIDTKPKEEIVTWQCKNLVDISYQGRKLPDRGMIIAKESFEELIFFEMFGGDNFTSVDPMDYNEDAGTLKAFKLISERDTVIINDELTVIYHGANNLEKFKILIRFIAATFHDQFCIGTYFNKVCWCRTGEI
jgi:hypothetical protein